MTFDGRSKQDYLAILARFPGPVSLHGDRRKWGMMLAIALLFVVASGFILYQPDTPSWMRAVAWSGIAFFGSGSLLSAVILLLPRSSELTLDREGFTMGVLFRRKRFSWRQASDFSLYARADSAGHKMVVYDDTAFTGTLAELNRKLSGRNSGLADTYGLSAEDLAELLNAWRDRAMRS
jgi:hypothetical protein